MPVRLIASDLDGTLLSRQGRLTERTIAAIELVISRGVEFVAATGRSHLSAASRFAPAPSVRWAVCSNGASLYDLHAAEVTDRYPISPTHMDALVDVWSAFPDWALAWEATGGFAADSTFQAQHPQSLAAGLPELRPPRSGVLKILVSHPEFAARELIDHLAPLMPADLKLANSGATFVEITGAGVTKASGLAKLCERLAIDASETIVFGDNHNDLPMFRWAGRAVAMSNAIDDVRAAAHDIAANHDDDGVAQFVEVLFSEVAP